MHQSGRGIDLLRSASSPSAIYNDGERFPRPNCHENTYVAVINRLMRWILGQENREAHIMWLLGSADVGKSAIAKTLAKLCISSKILLASFFFSRADPTRNHSRSLFATIAYQVATNFPGARDPVVGVPERVFTQSIEEQLSSLIIKPLQDLYRSGRPTTPPDPYLIIIDGLDECRDSATQISILQAISRALSACRFPLKFLITSRPEGHIASEFNSRAIYPILARLALPDNFFPDDVIRRFLRDKFQEIRETHPHIINPLWPPAETIEYLVKKSSGQLIFASTIIKYITSDTSRLPMASLDVTLGLHPSNADAPFAELDALYMNILSSVEDREQTLSILGFLIFLDITYDFQSRLTRTDFLDAFLMLSDDDSHTFAEELASLVTLGPVENDGHRQINLLDASLSDFLLDRSRSADFALNPTEVHAELAAMCLLALENIFKLEDNDPIPITILLGYEYACENLIKHCSAAAPILFLQNTIRGFSHYSNWDLRHHRYQSYYLESIPIVIGAIRATPFPDAESLCAPHVIAFESLLLNQLPQYYSNPTLTFLAAAVSIPSKVPCIQWDNPTIPSFFGSVEQEMWVDSMSLQLFSFLFNHSGRRNVYKEYLADFLTTNMGSRIRLLSGQHYSIAAQQCFRYLDDDRCYTDDITSINPSLTEWVLECLPTFLDQSSKTRALVHAARCIKFNRRVGEFPGAASMAKIAVERYLIRCMNEDEDEILMIRTPSHPSRLPPSARNTS